MTASTATSNGGPSRMLDRGVYPILPTPFDNDGSVDERSLRRLIDFQVAAGARGVAILGFLGEAHKLAESERRVVVRTVLEQADGRLATWVGVRAFGTAGAVEQAHAAQELGADAVFVAPIGVQNDAALFDFYRDVAAALEVPVIVHDFPESFGTVLAADLVARLANEVEGVQAIKLEDPPVLQKLTRLRELAPDTLAIYGGLGGEYFLEELQRGAHGIMTGFAFPEVLVGIQQAFDAGDEARAAAIFDRYCPLIRYEFQPKIGLAFRKHVYHRRGIFDTTVVRPPAMRLDARTERELEATIARVGLALEPAPQEV